MKGLPILILGFNRPLTLARQLSRVNGLERRQVFLSIDGPMQSSLDSHIETVRVAESWAATSQHDVEVIVRPKNFGIYDHLPKVLEEFFSFNRVGIVLEDDIEFVPSFIHAVESFSEMLVVGNVWSICGHNPLSTEDPTQHLLDSIALRPSYFHSIWGWATSSQVAENFVKAYSNPLLIDDVNQVLKETAKKITKDPLLQQAFRLTWLNKMTGWQRKRRESGWDTRWVYEAWKMDMQSLVSDISLSREELNQTEGQTHAHLQRGVDWSDRNQTSQKFYLGARDPKSDIDLLATWGIRRKYSWFYASRIRTQILNTHS